jgi:acetylornithine deacetylase/succinyl-diaminopimelate desuccinylase-like protein
VAGEWCISEGGGEAYTVAGKTMFACMTAEKGVARFKVTVRGPAGHGSIPRRENAVVLLAKAMERLGQAALPLHRTPTMDGLLTTIAGILGNGATLDSLLAGADDRAQLQRFLPDEHIANMFYAMLHNTVTPTMLKAGERINVIPSVAEGWVDGRILPGQTKESFRAEIDEVLRGLPVELDWTAESEHPGALESPPEGALYDAIRDVVAEHAPDGLVIPFLVTGGTDAKSLAPAGVHVYGFCPMLEDAVAPSTELVHNHNERISVENLLFGTKVLYDVIRRFCAA